jgi:UDP-glucose 4-epimerase
MHKKTILVTGVLGYLGSHTAARLLEKGYRVIGLDNESRGMRSNLDGIKKLCDGRSFFCIIDDIRNSKCLEYVWTDKIDAVIHFAGFKSVSESQDMPLEYYDNNVAGTINFISTMRNHGINKMVFSSSATIYGNVKGRVSEAQDKDSIPTNVYGETKKTCEDIIKNIVHSDIESEYPSFPGFSAICLRYFNPIGFHESGLLCENLETAENIIPSLLRVIKGEKEKFSIFGNDYNTPDGTAIRDYIDVNDLVEAHILALEKLLNDEIKYGTFNIGSEQGYSVMDILNSFEKAGYKIPYSIASRRPGDIEHICADSKLAYNCLGWKPENNIEKSVQSIINYLEKNKIINKNLF